MEEGNLKRTVEDYEKKISQIKAAQAKVGLIKGKVEESKGKISTVLSAVKGDISNSIRTTASQLELLAARP
jgi:hypothetical protein